MQKENGRKAAGAVILVLLAAVLVLLAVEVGKLRDVDRTYEQIVKRLGTAGDLPAQKEENNEVIARLTVEGTAIDVPVTQAKDNVKYLNTDVAGELSFAGNPFLDYRNSADFSDVYAVIYGHHMEDHLMFGDLDLCLTDAFWEGTRAGALLLPDGRRLTIRFFAAVRTTGDDDRFFDPLYAANNWDGDHLAAMTEGAAVSYGTIAQGDRVLALSTCEGANTEGRILLLGKLEDAR